LQPVSITIIWKKNLWLEQKLLHLSDLSGISCIYTHTHIYISVYIQRERERERSEYVRQLRPCANKRNNNLSNISKFPPPNLNSTILCTRSFPRDFLPPSLVPYFSVRRKSHFDALFFPRRCTRLNYSELTNLMQVKSRVPTLLSTDGQYYHKPKTTRKPNNE